MTHKIILLVITCALSASLSSCSSDTQEGDPNYFSQSQISVRMKDETMLYLSDTGNGTAMISYDRSNPLHLNQDNKSQLTTYVGQLVIPATVTSQGNTYQITGIDEMAFANNTTLTSLTLPESITTIGQGAFMNCSALVSVNIPTGVTAIPSSCFAQCKKMTKFELPEGIKNIGTLAFANCGKMTSITIPEGVNEIADRAFLGCTAVKELTIPSSVNKMGGNVFFRASKLTKIHLKATTPPELTDSLGDYISKATLYVPTGCKTAYEENTLWNKFKSIIEE